MPPPTPPIVKDGRMMAGNPVVLTMRVASSIDRARPLAGVSTPISFIASRNSRRSSPSLMASTFAPISFTPYLSSTPASWSATARLSAVCPPTVGRIASGRSFSMTFVTASTVSGSMYGAVGHLRIRHDGRRIAVDEDDVEPFRPQRLARLRARVVELARLADDDRAGADDEDAFEIFSSRHY